MYISKVSGLSKVGVWPSCSSFLWQQGDGGGRLDGERCKREGIQRLTRAIPRKKGARLKGALQLGLTLKVPCSSG